MYTLITGASSGIGLELAKQFAKNKHDLILVARRKEKLDALAQELSDTYKIRVETIEMDLSLPGAAKEVYEEVLSKQLDVDVLVNNAGFGDHGFFTDTDLDKELNMIDLNVKTLVALTKYFVLPMKKRGTGYILNVASTAAFQPGPVMSIYFATKAFVLSFSEAIANELAPQGIFVTALCPGATKTEFEDRAFGDSSFFSKTMSAEEVAKIGYNALLKKKRVIIPGFGNKLLAFTVRFSPRKLVTALTRKMFSDPGGK
jgi:uncharacterized protein